MGLKEKLNLYQKEVCDSLPSWQMCYYCLCKGALPVCQNILCLHFVWNPLLLLKTHLWNKMNDSNRHFSGGSTSLYPAHPGLWIAPFFCWNGVMALCAFKTEPHGFPSFLRSLLQLSFTCYLRDSFLNILPHFSRSKYFSFKVGRVGGGVGRVHCSSVTVSPHCVKILRTRVLSCFLTCSKLAVHHPLEWVTQSSGYHLLHLVKTLKCGAKSQL